MHKTITNSQSLEHPAYDQATTTSSPLYGSRQLAPRGSTSWRLPRSTPYARARGRGGRMSSTHRNRVLILNNATDATQNTNSQSSPGLPATEEGSSKEGVNGSASWVSKRDRHMQLINTSIYDKEKQLRRKAMNETIRKKALAGEHREKARIAKHLQSIMTYPGKSAAVPTSTELVNYEILINGVRFRVMNGGSKLSRILGRQSVNTVSSTRLTHHRCFEFSAFYTEAS